MQTIHISFWDRNEAGLKLANRLSGNLDKTQEDAFHTPSVCGIPFLQSCSNSLPAT